MRHILSILLLGLATVWATSYRGASAADTQPWNGEIQTFGALRSMYHEGQIGPQVTLDGMLPNQNFYAVGALADLSGEITILGGKVFLSYPDGLTATRTEVTKMTDAGAALLISTNVGSWTNTTTDAPIAFDDIGRGIARLAAAAGFEPDQRIPFLLEGEFEDLRWHVIDGGKLTAGGSSHKDHLEASVQHHRERTVATLVGFFSTSDQGVFTHHDSTTHIHCVLEQPLASGHVDHVIVPAGTTVKFPVL